MHTKVYKYNVKIVKKGLEGSFRLKHIIQIFIYYTLRAFEFKQKKKKIEFDRLLVKLAGIPVRTDCTAAFEFKFEFDRFLLVTGQTGPAYRNRTPPVWPDRSGR